MEVEPKITQEPLTRSNELYGYRSFQRVTFEDSETIVACLGATIRLSLDNGKKWMTVLEIEEKIDMVFPDKFYGKCRAFAADLAGGLYITENQGKDWMKIRKPLEVARSPFNTVESHPLARNCILLNCNIESGHSGGRNVAGDYTEEVSYISKDFGKSFERIHPPMGDYCVPPDVAACGIECWFAAASRYSALPKELVYGLHSITAVDNRGFSKWNKQVLFYSLDFGKTMNLVEELKEYQVFRLKMFPRVVLSIARKDDHSHQIEELWFSTGGPFKRAILPREIKYPSFGEALEDDLGRILLPFYTKEDDGRGRLAHLLILDLPESKLSKLRPIHLNPSNRSRCSKFSIEKFGNCKGILLGRYFGTSTECGQPYVSMAIHDDVVSTRKCFYQYMNLISFDNGNNWSNLRLIDHPNIRKLLSEYKINSLEDCSLQLFYYTHSKRNTSMAKVFVAKGAISHSQLEADESTCMSFISRDAGISWELAFTFPVYFVIADVGKIIVAIPQQQKEFNSFRVTKVFFSSNEGRTWTQHQLKQYVLCDEIQVDTCGSEVSVMLLKLLKARATIERESSVVLKLDFSL